MSRSILTLMILAALGGCSTLPRDGPSGRAVDRGAAAPDALGGYALVNLDYGVSERIKTIPPRFLGSLTDATSEAPLDIIGVGDVLAVSVFEPSGALFGRGASSGSASASAAGVQGASGNLPAVVVDRDCSVGIPFAGRLRVAGMTPTQASDAIRRALVGKVGNPQVMVAVAQNNSNTVTVLGEVRQPGRAPLGLSGDRILDVLAATGGATRSVEDAVVNIQRAGRTYSAPLSVVSTDFNENVRLMRGDVVNVTYRPRRYSTFGALGAVRQNDMTPGPLSLTGALGGAGGLDSNQADARRVMVFRFERPEVAQALGITQAATPRGVPVVYQLNLAETSGFFIASNFMIQPDDIVYAPRAGTAEARKFFEFVQSITRVVYDISVTSALNIN